MRGVVLGGAYGDALGAPVEFMRRDQILARFGPNGITDFAPAYGRLGAITDDTQLTLFTLEGLMEAQERFEGRGICHPPSMIHAAYYRWYDTQTKPPPTDPEPYGGLINEPALWSRRGPGGTCLEALGDPDRRYGRPAVNDRKGAGGIMRVAPIGLYAARPYELAGQAAALTHGHITSTVASGWFAAWIGLIAKGVDFGDAAQQAWARCRGKAPELDAALAVAFDLAASAPTHQTPRALGAGWIAEEAAALTLWCVLVAPSPIDAVSLAVNHSGDSDTTGSMTGQVLGAGLGTGWIPEVALAQLELRDVMEGLCRETERVFGG